MLKQVTDDAFEADSNMIRAIKLKRDLEITAESYHRILNEMKKRKKQLLMTMFFKKDAKIINKRSVIFHAVYTQLRRTMRQQRTK
ncbi:hypothetical protein T08_4359 [Trichinella sp. T8]|nr:hypothetical protein T08_4359 [Trichinella sp. T8]